MKKNLLKFIVYLGIFCHVAWAQNRSLTGIVSDEKEAIIGALIQVKGTKIGTSTNVDGRFLLQVPNEATTLIVKHLGMVSQEVNISGLSDIKVVLKKDNLKLEEMVITAVGIQKEKRALGFSSQKIDGAELKGSGEQNIVNSISGKAAGVLVTSSGGTPGASSKILLRGNRSFSGDNQPLFVVDGVPIDNSTDQSSPGDAAYNSNLQGVNNSNRAIDINPDDIESVNILKGPAAAALYGVRGANGAIIITTKRARIGGGKAWEVTIGSSVEVSEVNKLPNRQMKYSQGSGGGSTDSLGNPVAEGTYSTSTPQSWGEETQKLINAGLLPGVSKPINNADEFFKTAYSFNNNISIAHHTDKTSYRFSIGRLTQNGVVPNTNFNRTSLRLSVDNQLSKKVKTGGTINYVNSGGTRSQNGSNLSGVMLGLLRTPNSFNNGSDGFGNGYKNTDGSQRQFWGAYDNPFWTVNENPFVDDVNRVNGNVYVNYDAADWLDVTYRMGTDFYTDQRKQIFSIGSRGTDNAPNGEIDENILRYTEYYSDLLVTFKKEINQNIKTSLMVGNNLNYRYKQDAFMRGRDLAIPNFYNLGNATNYYASEAHSTVKTGAFMFDANASYKNYLFLNIAGRNEWSSTFGNAGNSFFFPSSSLSFVFSEIWKPLKQFSFGKLRVAVAQAGVSPGTYSSRTYLGKPILADGFTGGLGFPYLGVNGYGYNSALGNGNIKPEITTSSEFGADLRFFDGRLNFDYTFFYQITSDIIVDMPIAPSSGFRSFANNTGEMKNWGHEILFSFTPIRKKDFEWQASFNMSILRNEVAKIFGGDKPLSIEEGFTDIGAYAVVGKPYGLLYGTRWLRNSDNKILIDDNGLPIKDASSGIIGNPYPDWFGGLRNTFTYKKFNFTFLFDVRKGGDIWNGTWARLNRFGVTDESADRSRTYVVEGIRQSDGKVNSTSISANDYFNFAKGDNPSAATENAIQDGSWLRLREVGFTYTFDKFKKANFIQQLQLNCTARNLALWTKYTGVDPETSLTGAGSSIGGFDYFNNPGTRSFIFSAKLVF